MGSTLTIRHIVGFALLLAGVFCISFPMLGLLDIEAILGIVLLISGAIHLVGAIREREKPEFKWALLISFSFLCFGLLLTGDPFGGVELLATVLFLFFLVNAIFILGAAFAQKESNRNWIRTLAGGLLFFALAILTFFGLMGNDPWTLGTMAGIALLSYGASLLATAAPSKSNKAKSSPKKTKAKKK